MTATVLVERPTVALGQRVRAWWDTGLMDSGWIYGWVVAAGPSSFTVVWPSGLRNRRPQGDRTVTTITEREAKMLDEEDTQAFGCRYIVEGAPGEHDPYGPDADPPFLVRREVPAEEGGGWRIDDEWKGEDAAGHRTWEAAMREAVRLNVGREMRS